MDLKQWLAAHWADLLTWLGIGGGSVGGGILGQRVTDRDQNRKIKQLREEMDLAKVKISDLEKELAYNAKQDAQLREDLREHRESLNERLVRMESKQDKLIDYLFQLKDK